MIAIALTDIGIADQIGTLHQIDVGGLHLHHHNSGHNSHAAAVLTDVIVGEEAVVVAAVVVVVRYIYNLYCLKCINNFANVQNTFLFSSNFRILGNWVQNRRYDDRDHGRRYGSSSNSGSSSRDDRRGGQTRSDRDFRDGNRDKRTNTGGDNSRNRDRGVPKKEKDDKLVSNAQPHRINVNIFNINNTFAYFKSK